MPQLVPFTLINFAFFIFLIVFMEIIHKDLFREAILCSNITAINYSFHSTFLYTKKAEDELDKKKKEISALEKDIEEDMFGSDETSIGSKRKREQSDVSERASSNPFQIETKKEQLEKARTEHNILEKVVSNSFESHTTDYNYNLKETVTYLEDELEHVRNSNHPRKEKIIEDLENEVHTGKNLQAKEAREYVDHMSELFPFFNDVD